jgi:hypothetical protein
MRHTKTSFTGLLPSLYFSVFTCYVSNNLHSRFEHREETIQKEFSILDGKPFILDGKPTYFPEFQNRVLFATVLKMLTIVSSARPGQLYLFLKLSTALLAFFSFWLLVTTHGAFNLRIAALGMSALAYTLIFEFNHGWEHPTDFPDVMFTALFILISVNHRMIILIFITVLSCFSRESAVFAGTIWFFLYGLNRKFQLRFFECVYSIMLCLGSYAVILAIRYSYAGMQGITRFQTLNLKNIWPLFIKPILQHPTPSSWPFLLLGMITPIVWWMISNRKFISQGDTRLLMAATMMSIISTTLASINELRIFIPSTTILVFVATSLEMHRYEESREFDRSDYSGSYDEIMTNGDTGMTSVQKMK